VHATQLTKQCMFCASVQLKMSYYSLCMAWLVSLHRGLSGECLARVYAMYACSHSMHTLHSTLCLVICPLVNCPRVTCSPGQTPTRSPVPCQGPPVSCPPDLFRIWSGVRVCASFQKMPALIVGWLGQDPASWVG